jgi:hypothetical protein
VRLIPAQYVKRFYCLLEKRHPLISTLRFW